jgi:hypothetical protein
VRYYGVQNEVKSYLNRLQSEEGIEVSLGTVKTLNDRVEDLKKSGVWSQYGLGFNDGDADRYFQRASVNDPIGRFEVCLFVRGMKTLGLWQNMVSWPMRSYQNAGTGSTVYSLGGLSNNTMSLVNSPTWALSGINFNAPQYGTVSDFINDRAFNLFIRSVQSTSKTAYARQWSKGTVSPSQFGYTQFDSATVGRFRVNSNGTSRFFNYDSNQDNTIVYSWEPNTLQSVWQNKILIDSTLSGSLTSNLPDIGNFFLNADSNTGTQSIGTYANLTFYEGSLTTTQRDKVTEFINTIL